MLTKEQLTERARELRRYLEVHIKHDGPCSDNAILAALEHVQREAAERYLAVYPVSEYHDDYSAVLWWHFPVCEPPIVGVPEHVEERIDTGWITHWSRMPMVWDGNGNPWMEKASPAATGKEDA